MEPARRGPWEYGAAQAPQGPRDYGAAQLPEEKSVRVHRRRMNLVAVCECVFLPWLLYSTLSAVMTFSLRHDSPAAAWIIALLLLFVVLTCGALAWQARLLRAQGEGEPAWCIFLSLILLLAWTLAMVVGCYNYSANMAGYYTMSTLSTYAEVDPAQTSGKQILDAGRVFFAPAGKVGPDAKRTMTFKNKDTYCVAPIAAGRAPLASYDFWAVGKNCCSAQSGRFHCGEADYPRARTGLRWTGDADLRFFKLAVEQAEAAYGIRASHPLFFSWVYDSDQPPHEGDTGSLRGGSSKWSESKHSDTAHKGHRDAGFRLYLLGSSLFFAFDLVSVLLAAFQFSKMGDY